MKVCLKLRFIILVNFNSKKYFSFFKVSKDFYLDEILKEQFKGRIFDNQWFGVSLASTGSGGFSVIYFWDYCFRCKNQSC